MNELARILEACRQAREDGRPAVLATVVRVEGSAYRRPGARMVFVSGHDPVGLVSGGCLEEDLALRAREVLDSGRSRTVVYDMRSPDDIVWGLGLGCNGEVRVLLEILDEDGGYLEFLRECSRFRRPGIVVSVFETEGPVGVRLGDRRTFAEDGTPIGTDGAWGAVGESVARDASRASRRKAGFNASYVDVGGRIEALIEYVAAPVSLIVFGAGMDALPVVQFADRLGWNVTVADHRPAYTTPERFPQADAVVRIEYDRLAGDLPPIDGDSPALVMTHHFLHDLALLEFLLPTAAPYVGVLGPRKRTEKLLEQLAARGVVPSREQLGRLHGPVGLDIGAETPEEIALSALAEIRAVLNDRRGGYLRDRSAALHGPP